MVCCEEFHPPHLSTIACHTLQRAQTRAHAHTHSQAHQVLGMVCDSNGPSYGGTFNCLVIVSMLSVSQSIKPH